MTGRRRFGVGGFHAQRYSGLLFVVLWQAMPVGTYTDEAGRTRVGFGFGAAQFENVSFDCEGRPTSVERGRAVTGGVQLETFVDARWRVSASLGLVDDSYSTGRDPRARAVGAALVVHEGEHAAFGGGLAALPRRAHADWESPEWDYLQQQSSYMVVPTAHLRLGSERVHFRADLLPPAPALGALGEMRAGVGFGAGPRRRGINGFGGVALCHFCFNDAGGSANTSAFIELGMPVQRSFDIDIGALVGPGEESANLGVTIGGRVYLGRPIPRTSEPSALPEDRTR